MDFELKNFEDKINDITTQFMSLLDQENAIENKVANKFESAAISFDKRIEEASFTKTPSEVTPGYSNGLFRFDVDNGIQNPKVGGITFEKVEVAPAHAIKLDNDYSDLNRRLEELYQEKRSYDFTPMEKPSVAFSDSNLAAFNSYALNSINYTNEKTNSGNEKEGYNMANYGFTEGDDNSIFSFATVPQERALTTKRSFADVLFMDIPWDTKIDIWGGIKTFLNTEVRITF